MGKKGKKQAGGSLNDKIIEKIVKASPGAIIVTRGKHKRIRLTKYKIWR